MFKLMFVLFAVAASSAMASPSPAPKPGVASVYSAAPIGLSYAAAPVGLGYSAYSAPLVRSYGYSTHLAAAPVHTAYSGIGYSGLGYAAAPAPLIYG